MSEEVWTPLERAIVSIINDGIVRCGAGFGKYPLGVRAALRELEPMIATEYTRKRLVEFDERLTR